MASNSKVENNLGLILVFLIWFKRNTIMSLGNMFFSQ
jgi:hypothetical protein